MTWAFKFSSVSFTPNAIAILLGLSCNLFCLLQLFLLNLQLLLSNCKLLLDLPQLLALVLNVPFGTSQCSLNTLPLPIYLGQLNVEVLNSFFSHEEGLDSNYALGLLFLELVVGIVYPLFSNVGHLDCL